MRNSNTLRGVLFGLLAASIWGGMYVVSDVVLKTIPPFSLLTTRLLLGILVLGIMIYSQRDQLAKPTSRESLQLLGIGFLGFGISVGAQFVGTDKSSAINGSLVTSASPAFILVFAAILLKEKLSIQRIAAVVLATIGVIIIVDLNKADFSSETYSGNIALAIAAITWGLYSILIRRASAKTNTLIVTFVAFIGGLFLTIPASIVELQSRSIATIDFGTLIGVLYLGVISTAGAMWLWNRAFAITDASLASLTFFAQPLVGTILSILLLGQKLESTHILGGALIIFGVLLSVISVKPTSALASLVSTPELNTEDTSQPSTH